MVNIETSFLFNEDYINATSTKQFKSIDRGYNKIKKQGKYIEFYTTSCIGNLIRNAETGEYYNFRVGSKDELLLFSIILATGKCNSKNNSCTLFYNSPEEYINHFRDDLDIKIIQKWYDERSI
jgi:hypothetical protein